MSPLAVAVFCCLLAGQSFAASIGLFSSPDCSTSNVCIPAGQMDTLYIRASTDGLPDDQYFTAAEFRITGLPEGWSTFSTPESNTFAVGDPFGLGASINFGFSQLGSCIALYTVIVLAVSEAYDIGLVVTHISPPGDPTMPCPRINVICSARPCDISYCVEGGLLSINSTIDCKVMVSQRTWSRVKALYKEGAPHESR